MEEILNKVSAWLTSGNTSAYVVICLVILVFIYFTYKFRKSDIIKDIIANILLEEEKNAIKGEGKVIEIVKKVRDRLPKFLSVMLSDKTLKKFVADSIDKLQEKLDVDEVSREVDITKRIIEAYEIIRDNDCTDKETKDKVQSRINNLLSKLEKIS